MRVAGLLTLHSRWFWGRFASVRQLIRKIGFPKPDSGLFPGLLQEFIHRIDPMVLHSAGLLRPAKLAGADK